MAADEESWRRTVLERTSSVLQEAARKMESELNNTLYDEVCSILHVLKV